ncbi:DUF1285 domain-containing protein [Xanthobacter sp. TB0139]|uniref:DUF1285 domain-containing protein n=1 Tax=Xanthobacter sp. TB0139 TaxID=3459178 RepID=UPI0040390EEF
MVAVSGEEHTTEQTEAAPSRLDALMAAVQAAGTRGPAPVHLWNPPDCGEMDLRIAADGRWYYMGSPIGRQALVRLFASVLAREGERYVLKTPVEKIGIQVEDAPFLAVELAVEEGAEGPVLVFRTNLDDVVRCGPENPMRFAPGGAPGEFRPYVLVRNGLEARLTRATAFDLVARGEVRDVEGVGMFGVASGSLFFPIMPAAELDRLTGVDAGPVGAG